VSTGPVTLADSVLALVAPLLLDDVDRIAARLFDQLLEDPVYAAGGPRLHAEVRDSCRSNIARTLQQLAGLLPAGWELESHAATGRRRAQQGLALDSLVRAYRLGGQLIWQALAELGRRPDSGVDPVALLDAAGVVWRISEQHCVTVTSAYRQEEARLRSHDQRRRAAVLDGLLTGRGSDPAWARDAAAALSIPLTGRFACLVLALGSIEQGTPEQALPRGLAAVWQVRGGHEVGLVWLQERSLESVVAEVATVVRRPLGVSPVVRSLADVALAFRLAEVAVRTTAAGHQVALLDDWLPEALVAGSPELASRLLAATVDRLAGLPPGERDVLVDTVESVLACDGSPARAAVRLYCHRNTVMNRLARVVELTGWGLDSTRERLMWGLALMALRQGQLPGPATRPGTGPPAQRDGRAGG
jgi:hypothetical protein